MNFRLVLPARPRLMPCVIAGLSLLAIVKGTALLRSAIRADGVPAIEVVSAAMAASHPAPAPAAPPAPAVPVAAPAPPAPPAPPAEPAVSDAERALLQDLRTRREQLDAKARDLSAREGVMAAAERRLGARVEELTALQTRLEALESARKEREEANWRGLVKTYEAMRPRDAAAIMNDLEMPVLLQVLDRMKETKTAPILAAMLPERARAATAQLAQMRVRQSTPGSASTGASTGASSATPSG